MENICIAAYRGYLSICKRYEMSSVSFYQFIRQLTEEQINEYSKLTL